MEDPLAFLRRRLEELNDISRELDLRSRRLEDYRAYYSLPIEEIVDNWKRDARSKLDRQTGKMDARFGKMKTHERKPRKKCVKGFRGEIAKLGVKIASEERTISKDGGTRRRG